MEKKKPFAQSVEAFFAGKGFYIVLFLCVAVIGVSRKFVNVFVIGLLSENHLNALPVSSVLASSFKGFFFSYLVILTAPNVTGADGGVRCIENRR